MEHRITATDLARRLGDVLGRVRYRGDTFVVERNGEPVACVAPVPGATAATALEAFRAWAEAAPADASFADDLERVGAADEPPLSPWAS
jgi:prevent-host-death family protein